VKAKALTHTDLESNVHHLPVRPEIPFGNRIQWLRKGSVGIVRKSHIDGPVEMPGTILIRINGVYCAYDDVYRAWRSCIHVLRASGMFDITNGVLQELFVDRTAIKQYQAYVFDPAVYDDETLRVFRLTMKYLEQSLKLRRKPMLAAARKHTNRAMLTMDSIGRHNPGAAAFTAEVAVQMLEQRSKEILKMMPYISMRMMALHREKMRVLGLYKELREALVRKGGRKKPAIIADALGDEATRDQVESALNETLRFHGRFLRPVIPNPFRNNAMHVVQDLLQLAPALEGLMRTPSGRLRTEIRETHIWRLRQGIAWAFTRHELERQIITPFSLISQDHEMQEGVIAKAVGGGSQLTSNVKEPLSFKSEPRLEGLVVRLGVLIDDIDLIRDDALVHSPKEDALANLREARQYAVESNDWEKFREHLDLAASFM